METLQECLKEEFIYNYFKIMLKKQEQIEPPYRAVLKINVTVWQPDKEKVMLTFWFLSSF